MATDGLIDSIKDIVSRDFEDQPEPDQVESTGAEDVDAQNNPVDVVMAEDNPTLVTETIPMNTEIGTNEIREEQSAVIENETTSGNE
jgi:hypothetical protein